MLRISGGADDRVTDTDAFFRDRHPVLRPLPLVPDAERTASAAESWTRRTIELLAEHPVNERRAAPACPLQRDHAEVVGPLTARAHISRSATGFDGTFVVGSPFLQGLARSVGLEPIDAPETGDAPADLRARVDQIERRLDAGRHVRVLTSQERPTRPGTRRIRPRSSATIEALDAELGTLPTDRAIVCVTGDHATPTYADVIHSGDPVPFLLAGPGVRADPVESFGELDCAGGILGHLRGPDMMPVLLNAADRPLFLGSRPTPFPGADGYPEVLEPLR